MAVGIDSWLEASTLPRACLVDGFGIHCSVSILVCEIESHLTKPHQVKQCGVMLPPSHQLSVYNKPCDFRELCDPSATFTYALTPLLSNFKFHK